MLGTSCSNHILSRLTRADFALLKPHLEAVDLPVRKPLAAPNKRIQEVYFLESGMASVVANGKSNIEVGIIGREGMTGGSLVMGSDERSPHETYMQIAGAGLSLPAARLTEAIDASVSLHRVLLRYVHSFMTQITQTALANGRSKIEERLARWLLMADDRVDDGELRLTHEFLGVMLGVQRPGVTVALQELERRGFIAHKRGVITILDRAALRKTTNGTYVPPRRQP
jgi:CRP-like cAMP-binding protein